MRLERVTITGADESVTPEALLRLSQAYPFCEWGILVSATRQGQPRFPSQRWIQALQALAIPARLPLALHLCGRWVTDLLCGHNVLNPDLLGGFRRIQLNFASQPRPLSYDAQLFAAALLPWKRRQLIFQVGPQQGEDYLEDVGEWGEEPLNCVPLFDASHGTGARASFWPQVMGCREAYPLYGYAGGLGPTTLDQELPRIAQAAGDASTWIDMEMGVRSADGQRLDLAKVLDCLELTAPWIGQERGEGLA
jgi:hypothetical protein